MNLKMLKMTIASLVLSVCGFANANLLLQADLSVENTITITATSATSLATVSGSDGIGAYLADFFDASFGSLSDILESGNLTSANKFDWSVIATAGI